MFRILSLVRSQIIALVMAPLFVYTAQARDAADHAESSGVCQLELAASPQTLRLRYDPFNAAPSTETIRLSVRNTGTGECLAAVALFRDGPPLARASVSGTEGLLYQLTGARGETLIVEGFMAPARLSPGFNLSTVRIAPGASTSIEITVVVARGQIAAPGEYRDALDIGVYRADGGAYEKAGAGGRLAVEIAAVPVMSLTLAGGGRKTTLNFGELAEGATRTVNLQAYTNQGFSLQASSENGGRMLPVDPAAQAEGGWQAPYTVSVNRAPHTALNASAAIAITPVATGLSGLAIPVEVRIGSIAQQRAGTYRDVITLTIKPGF